MECLVASGAEKTSTEKSIENNATLGISITRKIHSKTFLTFSIFHLKFKEELFFYTPTKEISRKTTAQVYSLYVGEESTQKIDGQ